MRIVFKSTTPYNRFVRPCKGKIKILSVLPFIIGNQYVDNKQADKKIAGSFIYTFIKIGNKSQNNTDEQHKRKLKIVKCFINHHWIEKPDNSHDKADVKQVGADNITD